MLQNALQPQTFRLSLTNMAETHKEPAVTLEMSAPGGPWFPPTVQRQAVRLTGNLSLQVALDTLVPGLPFLQTITAGIVSSLFGARLKLMND